MVTALIIAAVVAYGVSAVAIYMLSLFAGIILALGGMAPSRVQLLVISLLWPIMIPWMGVMMIIRSVRKKR